MLVDEKRAAPTRTASWASWTTVEAARAAGEPERAAGRAPRSARRPDLRAALERCVDRGRALPPRSRRSSSPAPASAPSVRDEPRSSGRQGPHPSRPAELRRRSGIPLQAHPRPRDRLPVQPRRSFALTFTSGSRTGSSSSPAERVSEYEEILGYHLEQSYRYRTELGPANDEIQEVGKRAASHLADAGRRALRRGDIGAASGLLGRAAGLLPAGQPNRAPILVLLGDTLMDAGRNTDALRAFDWLDGADGVDEVSRTHAELCRAELVLPKWTRLPRRSTSIGGRRSPRSSCSQRTVRSRRSCVPAGSPT